MVHYQTQELVQKAISAVDDLQEKSRGPDDPFTHVLTSVRELLVRLDTEVAAKGPAIAVAIELGRAIDEVQTLATKLPPEMRERTDELVGRSRMLAHEFAPSLEIQSRPLLGFLPITRVVPQDVHSVLDYVHGFAMVGSAFFSGKPRARFVGVTLGAGLLGVSALTDYRLSLRNIIPIEAHEAFDYLWGGAAIALPFALGYAKKRPILAAYQVALGVRSIVLAMVTDYRAAKGRGRPVIISATEMGAQIQPGSHEKAAA
jgi:hypothetical protein